MGSDHEVVFCSSFFSYCSANPGCSVEGRWIQKLLPGKTRPSSLVTAGRRSDSAGNSTVITLTTEDGEWIKAG